MKIPSFILTCITALLLTGCERAERQVSHVIADPTVADRLQSHAVALFLLAVERFQLHESRNEIWVFRVHDHLPAQEEKLEKYSDGQFIVASLPMREKPEIGGIRLYAAHLNRLTMEKADTIALNGNHEHALKIYRLIHRFDNCLSSREGLEHRIKLMEDIVTGGSKEASLTKLQELKVEHGSSVFESLETKAPTRVSNLFELNLDSNGRQIAGK